MENNTKAILFGIIGFLLGIVVLCCACFGLSFLFISSLGSLASTDSSTISASTSNNKILVVKISGIILNDTDSSPINSLASSGVTYGYEIQRELMDAAEDSSIKAVVIDVDSPGGTVVGSNAIAEGIEYYKDKTGNPVIGFGSGQVASGGYWVIAPSDEIIVDLGSSVGSIGVISAQLTYYDTLLAEGQFLGSSVETKNGIERYYITAGKGKDLGNPMRKPTEEELELLQDQANRVYDDFIEHVTSYREALTSDQIRNELGAYVYDTEMAVEVGLADRAGGRLEAIKAAAAAANLGDDYSLETVPQTEYDFFSSLLGITSQLANPQASSTVAQSPGCNLMQQGVIAYHGDVSGLCR